MKRKAAYWLRKISAGTHWLSQVIVDEEPEFTPDCEFCFIDVETTGLDPETQEIIEIALIRTDRNFDVLGQFQTKVFPKHIETAHPKALEINGYDPELWESMAFSAEETIVLGKPMLEKAIIVGQNVKFDISFLKPFFVAEGQEPNWSGYHSIDTASLALPYFLAGKIKNLSLKNICKELGVTNNSPHRAMGDAWATLEVARIFNTTYTKAI